MSDPIITVTNLTFSYPAAHPKANATAVLQNLSLNVNRGEIVSILGASGCGKTTLLNLIAGLLAPAAGNIQLADTANRKAIGYIFQQDALLPWRTVERNILLVREIHGNPKHEEFNPQVLSYLQAFHLKPSVLSLYPGQLSGGMRQRVSIIQSLMFNPELLLLDEPFSALDFYTKLQLESEFRQLIKQQNKSAILVTHDIDEAIAMSDRVLIMEPGGSLTLDHNIALPADRNPEESRGTTQFAAHYQQIWSELRTSIVQ